MTNENKKKNIGIELERASSTLKEADLLYKNNFISAAISRLYYHLLYNVRALLLTKGLEPRSHEGALRLLSLHFVKEGILEPQASHVLSRLMKYREEADYNPSYVFTGEDYLKFRDEADGVAAKIRDYLVLKKYL